MLDTLIVCNRVIAGVLNGSLIRLYEREFVFSYSVANEVVNGSMVMLYSILISF